MPELVMPTTRCHRSFVAAMEEFAAEGRGEAWDDSMVGEELRRPRWRDPDGFDAYVRDLIEASRDTGRPRGRVPCTTMWWVDGAEYLARISIRHWLTPRLRNYGGHIGYDVRASARRRGHATAMLAATLPVAHRLGIDPALITCDHDNIASRRVIERNGGVLEDVRGIKRRYWVATS